MAKELQELLSGAEYTTRTMLCKGCENNCTVIRYDFGGERPYYSGNRCERVFTNSGQKSRPGTNCYAYKNELLFSRATKNRPEKPLLRIGIPRVLNLYEDFPFWHTLFTELGMEVVLSAPSDYRRFEKTSFQLNFLSAFSSSISFSSTQNPFSS